jgi:hypothetical protein
VVGGGCAAPTLPCVWLDGSRVLNRWLSTKQQSRPHTLAVLAPLPPGRESTCVKVGDGRRGGGGALAETARAWSGWGGGGVCLSVCLSGWLPACLPVCQSRGCQPAVDLAKLTPRRGRVLCCATSRHSAQLTFSPPACLLSADGANGSSRRCSQDHQQR